jgi:hypothetical protein
VNNIPGAVGPKLAVELGDGVGDLAGGWKFLDGDYLRAGRWGVEGGSKGDVGCKTLSSSPFAVYVPPELPEVGNSRSNATAGTGSK